MVSALPEDEQAGVAEGEPATFLFADLAGYTALTETHGDERAADLVAEFFAVVRGLLADYGAEEVKTVGDAVMLRVADAADAVGLGLRIVGEVGARHGHPGIRVGMHTGPAVERGGDYFGASVNLAARVAALAGAGEVLLSGETREAAGDLHGAAIVERGRQSLKNISEPVMIYAAGAEGGRVAAKLPIDPVCRMAVDPRHGAGSLSYEGVRYEFCSLRCAGAFADAPERFASLGDHDERDERERQGEAE